MSPSRSFLAQNLESVVGGVPLVLIGSGLRQFGDLLEHGGVVLGAIFVLPETFKAPELNTSFPVLQLWGRTGCYSELAASEFGATLAREEVAVGKFLDEIDPCAAATIACPYGLPHHVLRRRRVWAPEARLCRRLESKTISGAVLEADLPWVRAEPSPLRASRRWWRSACRQLGSNRLVIQHTGPNAGGTGTYLCETLEQAAGVIDSLAGAPGRVTPLLEGTPWNVMGFVTAEGQVMVLPLSRQLSFLDSQSRPIYAGNVVGETENAVEPTKIRADVGAAGRRLARAGYVGTFGLDFIKLTDGSRVYHDLNPRINGVASSFNMSAGPVLGALLSGPAWRFEDLVTAQEEIEAQVLEHPMARWRLTGVFNRKALAELPLDGHYRLDPGPPKLTWLGPEMAPDLVGEDVAVVQASVFPGHPLEGVQQVIMGNLWCGLDASNTLSVLSGNAAVQNLIDALGSAIAPAGLAAS
jgi:hypothetical protein